MVCNHSFEDEEPISVFHTGVVTIINFSEKCGKLDLMSYLTECISKTPMKKSLVHKKCRRDFTDYRSETYRYYDESTFFAEVGGCDNVVCFRNMAKHVINEKWYKGRKDSIEDEAERTVVAASKLIKANIREHEYDTGLCPHDIDIADFDNGKQWITHLL